jgi:hypothetical protein
MSNKVPLAHRIAELAKRIKELSEQIVVKVSQVKEVSTNDSGSKHSKESK